MSLHKSTFKSHDAPSKVPSPRSTYSNDTRKEAGDLTRETQSRPFHPYDGKGNQQTGQNSRRRSEKHHSAKNNRKPRPNHAHTQKQSSIKNALSSLPQLSLNTTVPPLEGAVGAPELSVVVTSNNQIIEKWINEHIPSFQKIDTGNKSYDNAVYSIIGFDLESVAKTPWFPDRATLPNGPATIQLSTPTSSLIVQLLQCGDVSATHALISLREVINDPRVIKVGVGIDNDALELYRWSKQYYANSAVTYTEGPSLQIQTKNQHQEEQSNLWNMTSRFDLGRILPDSDLNRSYGLKEIALEILGVHLNKSKKLTLSNWAQPRLSPNQISYAARDAWVSAAILEKLQKDNSDVFSADSLLEMDFLKMQMTVEEIDVGLPEYKKTKKALKAVNKLMKKIKIDDHANTKREEKKKELQDILDNYQMDPPIFEKVSFVLPFY